MRVIDSELFTILVACLLLSGAGKAAESPSGGMNAEETFAGVPVTPPGQRINSSESYGELGARWWQWAAQAPAADSPLSDISANNNHPNCRTGQQGSIWFLAGSLGSDDPSKVTVKNCAIPPGKSLFFPVISNLYGGFLNDPPETRTAEAIREAAQVNCDSSTLRNVSVKIDGVAIPSPLRFLTTANQSPLFEVQLPTDNVFGVTKADVPQLLVSPSAQKGIYIHLRPLSPGDHVIAFKATWDCNFAGELSQNFQYHVKVLRKVPGLVE